MIPVNISNISTDSLSYRDPTGQNQWECIYHLIHTTINNTIERLLPLVQYPKTWMTIKETCEYLSLGDTKIRSLISNGTIPSHWIDGSIRINRKELDLSVILGKNVKKGRVSQRELDRAAMLMDNSIELSNYILTNNEKRIDNEIN